MDQAPGACQLDTWLIRITAEEIWVMDRHYWICLSHDNNKII